MKHQLLIVDGYNMIGSWPELVQLKNQDKLEDARDSLLHTLSNFAKFEGSEVIVVFDAQFVPGIQKVYQKYQLTVVFTKKDETADSYIERLTFERLNAITQVTVATSDLAEQWVVFSKGALRKSANELYKQVKKTEKKIHRQAEDYYYDDFRRNQPWREDQLTQLKKFMSDMTEDEKKGHSK